MIYKLPLSLPFGRFSNIDLKERAKHKECLEPLPFAKRLKYYNDNIRSLSTYSNQAQIFYEWGNPNQKIKVFCNCNTCRKQQGFDLKEEQIFIKLRDKEVQRLIDGVNEAKTYKDKLAFMFGVKGYNPENPPNVFANIPIDTTKNANREMYFADPVIDLTPQTDTEIKTYNGFVWDLFTNKYGKQGNFTQAYYAFNFDAEKEKLNKTLRRSHDKEKLLSYIKSRIENHFHYTTNDLNDKSDSISTKGIGNHIVETINQQLENMTFGITQINTWFAKMVMGIEIDLNEKRVCNDTLINYTHLSEVAKYYVYVKGLHEGNDLPLQKPEIRTLHDLKVPQIALIHVYEKKQITRDNAKEIAAQYHYKSGEGLFQDYVYYASTANRKGKPDPCTKKKLRNKITLLESVLPYLSENNQNWANEEIEILKTIYQNEFE